MWDCLQASCGSATTANRFPGERDILRKEACETSKPGFTFLQSCRKGISFEIFANQTKTVWAFGSSFLQRQEINLHKIN